MSSDTKAPAGGEADPAFHYPPDLLEQLVDTIPLLFRSKKAVLLFFEGAGVPRDDFADIEADLTGDGSAHSKFGIARTVLTRLNQRADAGLRARREIIKRVVEFEDFGTTWDGDRMRAKGQVASIRERVNMQDAFTRMAREREGEAARHREAHEQRQREVRERREALDAARDDLFALFGEANPQRRGKLAEKALNNVFAAHGISVRDAFELVGDEGEGVVEQIDGVVELDGAIYLVEMKWLKENAGTGAVSQHLVRVIGRAGARGIIIAHPGFTDAAIMTVREALGAMTVVLVTLEEIVAALSGGRDLAGILRAKVRAALIDRQPFVRVA